MLGYIICLDLSITIWIILIITSMIESKKKNVLVTVGTTEF